jgi:hypothetical protein
MEWLDLLNDIFRLCVVPLLAVLTTYLVNYIKAKSNELVKDSDNELEKKYMTMLADTITDCVLATNQTYVEALKNQNAFTKEAQEEAFKQTFDAVMAVLNDDAKAYLTNVYGDLTVYLTKKIEAEVNKSK